MVFDRWSSGKYTHDPRKASRERKNCKSSFKKHNRHEQVQIFDIYCGFFSCQHLAVGRHHRRRTPQCPRGLSFGRIKVFLADQMHARSGVHYKLSFLRFYVGCCLHNPLVGRRIESSFVLFFELVKCLARFNALLRAHRSCLSVSS